MAFQGIRQTAPLSLGTALLLLFLLLPLRSPLADACVVQPDRLSPNEQVLLCGSDLTVRPAPGTRYRPADAGQDRPPASVELDSGALLIEFHASKKRRDFQILTPLAIASVRGTKWAVEATADRTSVLVLRGAVRVARVNAPPAVTLRQGQGVDVRSDGQPLQVKKWSRERVDALMARFGP
jgi:FecR protein